jgi:putative transposase
MTTNENIRGVKKYGWQRFENKLWQRNYWERIIRTENDINRISEYIVTNPKKWIIKNNL